MDNNEIISAVKSGMTESARVTKYMNYDSGGMINTEYVATVTIGTNLVNSKSFNYGDEKVIFEYSTKKFISATVPLSVRKDPHNPLSIRVIRKFANTSRSGRIDIAVMGNNNGFDYPKCAIEVKGNNPSSARLLEDIQRNLEYFKHEDKTGKSSLNLALNCIFESFNRKLGNRGKTVGSYAVTYDHRDKLINDIKLKYEKHLTDIKSEIPSFISTKVEVFSASEALISSEASQEDYDNIEDELHLTLAVLLIFERVQNQHQNS